MKFVTDIKQLSKPCKEVSLEEGLAIGQKLLDCLHLTDDGIGLAANQIGIDAAVCVVNVKEPLVFVNPKIQSTDGEFIARESCLSFPGKSVLTKRSKWVGIKDDNIGNVVFGPTNGPHWDNKEQQLESICVQHEVSHLQGKTMYDFEHKQEPIKHEKKIGRNDKVLIACGVESKVVKYKKAIPLLEQGWVLVEA